MSAAFDRATYVPQATNARLADYEQATALILGDLRTTAIDVRTASLLLHMETESAAAELDRLERFGKGTS